MSDEENMELPPSENEENSAQSKESAKGNSSLKEKKPKSASSDGEDVKIPLSKIDLNALWVVRRLRAKGYEAYLTGGCVRDLLLNKSPKDFDVATSARPEEVKSVFRNCRLIGRRFLLAHVIFPGGKIIETATFRANPMEDGDEDAAAVSESDTEDLLVIKDNVYGTVQADAFRRDLTVNGLFYDPIEEKVIDFVGGLEDLKNKVVRTIGDPVVRFQEDPVRILRAVRFSQMLGFEIEKSVMEAMKTYSVELLRCAPARIQEEIAKLLLCGKAKESFEMALKVGILEVLLPELLEGFLGVVHTTHEDVVSFTKDNIDTITKSETYSKWLNALSSLDKLTQANCLVQPSVAFSCLLLPVYQFLEGSKHNERNWIDRLCVSWSERIRLTRKDQDTIRLLLSAIPLFALEKIHQESAKYLVRKPWFREALLLYINHLLSEGLTLDPVFVWKKLAQEAQTEFRQTLLGSEFVKEKFSKPKFGGRFRKRSSR